MARPLRKTSVTHSLLESELGRQAVRFALILLGSFLAALSINTFFVTSGLLAGGVAGIGLIVRHTLGLPLSLTIVITNIPLVLLGWRYLHRGYMIRTLAGTCGLALFVAVLPPIQLPMKQDLLLMAVFGGILKGVGFGLTFKGRGSTGGTDIIALVLNRLYGLGIGLVNFYVNAGIVVAGAFLFNLHLIGYTLIAMYIGGVVTDRVQMGLNQGKMVLIVSDKSDTIAPLILHRLRRGVTILDGEGAYSHARKRVLLTTVKLFQIAKLKELVAAEDPAAFVIVTDTSEVVGRGFIPCYSD